MDFENKNINQEPDENRNTELNQETTALDITSASEADALDSRIAPKRTIGESVKDFFGSRRFKHGGLSTAITVFFIIAVIVFNIVAVILVERVPQLSPDLTGKSLFTLSDTSIELLGSLDEDITIDILASQYDCENPSPDFDPYSTIPQAHELIKRYAQYSSHITINYVDLDVTPGYKNQYPEFADLIKQYYIVVSSNRRNAITSFYDMLPYLGTSNDAEDSVLSSYVETEICSKIKTVSMDNVPVVAFLQCTNSEDPNGLQIQLSSNGYEVQLIDFNSKPIPEEADIAVVSGLAYDLTENQINQLSDFIYNDENLSKDLFFIFSPSSPETPNLDAFLEEWGFEVTRDVIYETDPNRYVSADVPSNFFADYKEEVYSAGLADRGLAFANMASLDVNLLFDQKGNYTVTPLIGSTIAGTVWPNNLPYDVLKVDMSKNDVHYIMAKSELAYSNDEGDKLSSRVFVSGSLFNFSSDLVGSDALGNSYFFTNIFDSIAGISEQTVDVTPKFISTIDFTIDSRTSTIVTAIFRYIIPLGLLVAGIVVFLRRRHL